jgi:hypothetical protein
LLIAQTMLPAALRTALVALLKRAMWTLPAWPSKLVS